MRSNTGVAKNHNTTIVTVAEVDYLAGIINTTKDTHCYSMVVAFAPRGKNPMKIRELRIGDKLWDVVEKKPSEHTKNFWLFYLNPKGEQ